jgi:hypothetical protein
MSNQVNASAVAPGSYEFELRDPKTKEVYFTGSETVSVKGETVRRETSYFDSGKKEVQKDLFDFDATSLRAGAYNSVNKLTGEESTVLPSDAGMEVGYRESASKDLGKTVVKPSEDGYLANSAGDLIRANWDRLLAGNAIKFNLLIPSRAEYIPFQLVRRESTRVNGEEREVFALMPQNLLIRMLAPHLEFQFNKERKIRQAIFPTSLPIKGSKDKMVEMIFKS